MRSGFFRTTEWAAFGAAIGAMSLAAIAGCTITYPHQVTEARPGLADVRVLGPKGQKCYDFCAISHDQCREMCPKTSNHENYDCEDDCTTDSKDCLDDCPELQRPLPPKAK